MKTIDGATGEGGGQLFRMTLALSALTGEPVRITNIRAGRSKPGLARQHVAAGDLVTELCEGVVEGLHLGSREVRLRPGRLRGGEYRVDVETAGSATLVLQAALPPATRSPAPTTLDVRGGTDVRWSPPADYFIHVFVPLLAKAGIDAWVDLDRRGYYPKGGGRLRARVAPTESVQPLVLEELRGSIPLRGRAHTTDLPDHVLRRMKHAALQRLVDYPDVEIEGIAQGADAALDPGGGLVVWAETAETRLGASALAERGVPAEALGQQAADALRADLTAGATLDPYAADQLLLYLALAGKPSSFRVREITGHTRTMAWLLPQFLEVAIVEERLGDLWRIRVQPIRT